ncbi:hypothetical protein D3C76_1183120 [compost metagenome]
MQTANAQPDAVFIPAQHLDARTGFIGEDEGGAFVPRRFELILNILRQCVDATSHIHGLHGEEDIFRHQHI